MRRLLRGHGRVILGVAAVAVLFAIVWFGPRAQVAAVSGKEFAAENEARRTLVQLLGGLALLAGLWLTLRQVRASESGQVTERFSRAVEHLGSDRLPLRLGGIYALERIALDSRRDHWAVMEVLSALVRTESPRDDSKSGPIVSRVAQVALSVISRRDVNFDGVHHLDLRWTNLGLAELPDARLARADLSFSELSGSRLMGADLTGAKLISVAAVGADLSRACLDRAQTSGAHITGARLDFALLRGVDLSKTILRDSSMRSANLNKAVLAELTEKGTAYQWQVNFGGADLSFADLQDVEQWGGVTNWAHTNLFGVRNAPNGLVAWAMRCGAVAVEDNRQWWDAKMAARGSASGDDGR